MAVETLAQADTELLRPDDLIIDEHNVFDPVACPMVGCVGEEAHAELRLEGEQVRRHGESRCHESPAGAIHLVADQPTGSVCQVVVW